MKHSISELSAVCCAGILSFILYLNTLNADFAYDDSRAIVKNPDLQSSTPLVQLFYNDFWGTPLTHSGSHKSYRPLCVLTFRINHAVGALDPYGYHLTNVLLHSVVTATFTYVALLVTGSVVTCTVSGLLFASHPVHTEAVAGVVGRAELLSCLFFLLAILAYRQYCRCRDVVVSHGGGSPGRTRCRVRRWGWMLCTMVCTTCSMLSKEQGVTVLAVCLVYDLLLHSRLSIKQMLHLWQSRYQKPLEGVVLLLMTGVALVSFRMYFMGYKPPEFAPADNPASDSDSLLTRTLTYLYLPCVNLWLLLYPRTLSFDWSMDAIPLVEGLADIRNCSSFAVYVLFMYCILYMVKRLYTCGAPDASSTCGESSSTTSANNLPTSSTCGSQPHRRHTAAASGDVRRNGNATNGSGSSSQSSASTAARRRLTTAYQNKSLPTSSDCDLHPVPAHHVMSNIRHIHVTLLALSMLIAPFIPASNLFFYVGFVVAERVLYIPSLGFCLLVGNGVNMILWGWWQREVVTATAAATLSSSSPPSSQKELHQKLPATNDYSPTALMVPRGNVRHSRRRGQVTGLMVVSMLVVIVIAYSARTWIRNYDWMSEEKLYRSGIPVNPAKAWGNLANILNGQKKYQQAERAYKEALKYRANMADVYYNLGILLQEQKRYMEAIESYQMAIKCRPKLSMAYLNLGIVYALLGRLQEATQMYSECASLDTTGLKDPRLHEATKISALYNHARLLADNNELQEAIRIYLDAVDRKPSHYAPQSLYNMLGEAYYKLGKYDQAEHWYDKALQAKEDHIPAHLTMARLMHHQGKNKEAMLWYEKALKLDPTDSSIYQHYGQYLGEVGKYSEAADSYIQANQYSPDDFELIFNTANALRQASRNEDAEAYYRKAVELRPNEATAHMNLGAMLHYNQKLEEAEVSYQNALTLKPDDQVTQANLHKLRNLINKAAAAAANTNTKR